MSAVAYLLRRVADRLDPAGKHQPVGWHFTLEQDIGIVWHDAGQGCPAYYQVADYQLATDEADNPIEGLE